MKAIRHYLTALGLCCACGAAAAQAQVPPAPAPADEALRVFLDCNTCDGEFIRREITYVNWVRDRADADVHLIITSQSTGGGGREYSLRYIGLRAYRGTDDEARFATRQSDTGDEVRQQQTRRIGLGLARYAARGVNADRLQLTFSAPAAAQGASAAQQPHDPWNLWVFRMSVSGEANAESQSKNSYVYGSPSASRVSETWKLRVSGSAARSSSSTTLSDSSVYRSHTSRYKAGVLLVRSLSEHWSLGLQGAAVRSTRDNYLLNLIVMPELEFNIFPYKESSRRQFVFVYANGLSHANYADTTIFDRLKETRPQHRFFAAAEATQPWGSLYAKLSASSLLDDFSKNRLSADANFSVRVVRGLDLTVNGGYSRVRDQLSLLKEGASDQEILLQLKQLKTAYYYYSSVELSYTFGSKFNNVVNPRFTQSGDLGK